MKRAVALRLGQTTEPLHVRLADVLAADLAGPRLWLCLPVESDRRLIVNWVTTPPAERSGGHMTMLRLIGHLEQSGHRCHVYLYDVYGGDAVYYGSRIRE